MVHAPYDARTKKFLTCVKQELKDKHISKEEMLVEFKKAVKKCMKKLKMNKRQTARRSRKRA